MLLLFRPLLEVQKMVNTILLGFQKQNVVSLLINRTICIHRVVYLPIAIVLGLLGLMVDFPVITVIAVLKSPYMLFKGWHRLFQDCVGREGPFLETICVPFAGLAILLWPLAVIGAVLCSMVSGIVLGLYAAVIVYQVIFTNLISSLDLKGQNCTFSSCGGEKLCESNGFGSKRLMYGWCWVWSTKVYIFSIIFDFQN